MAALTSREEAISAIQDAIRIASQEIERNGGYLCRVSQSDFSKLTTALENEDYAEATRITRIISEYLVQPVNLPDDKKVECHVCGCTVPEYSVFDDGCPLCSIRR